MKKIITNKKSLIIAIILILGIITPQLASAFSVEDILEDAGLAVVRAFSKFLIKTMTFAVDVASDFFEAMFIEGLKGHQNIAKIGWDVARDVANIFFILFMVIIAFATILRLERYGIKELLPKVIIIALLINFSMVLCYVIIDFSNITAYFFIFDAKNAIPGEGEVSLAGILADSFKLPNLYLPFACQYWERELDKCYSEITGETAISNCVEQAERGLNECWASGGTAKTEEDDFWDIVVAGVGSSVVLLIAAFVLFAGGIMLLIRLITIWFLVMIVPLAFACYILPGLRKNWEAWWNQFIKWCIFAPVYSFFVWFAAKIALENKLNNLAMLRVSMTRGGGEPVNEFFASTGNILYFLFMGGILIGGLLAANQLGIRTAKTAMTLGKKWGLGALNWAGRKLIKYPKEAGYMAGGAAAQLLGKSFQRILGLKSIGRSIESRGKLAWQKTLSTKEMEAFKKRVAAMSPQQRAQEVKMLTHGDPAKLAIAQVMLDKKDDLSKDKKAASAAANILQAFGMTKEADDIRRVTPHTGKDRDEIERLTDEALTRGIHKEFREGVFKEETAGEAGEVVASAIARKQPTVKLALESINQIRRDTRPEFENALLRAIRKDSNFDAGNKRDRAVYAASTGKVVEAFTNYETGVLNKDAMGEFVKDMRPIDYADVDKASLSEIAPYITVNTARNMTRYLTTDQKLKYFSKLRDDVKAVIRKDWFPEEEGPTETGAGPSPGGAGPSPRVVDLKGGTAEENKETASSMLRDEMRKLAEREAKGREATAKAAAGSKAMEEKMRIMEEERKKAEKERPK
jgi:hypothetical protein